MAICSQISAFIRDNGEFVKDEFGRFYRFERVLGKGGGPKLCTFCDHKRVQGLYGK